MTSQGRQQHSARRKGPAGTAMWQNLTSSPQFGPLRPNRGNRRRAGFALVAVIWALGLIVLLASVLIVGARYRARASSDASSLAAAERAAESAINLALAIAISARPPQVDFPLKCRMPGGEWAIISVEEENGKVDLNTANAAVLARFFTALTRDQSRGQQVAARILEFRDQVQKHSAAADANGSPPARPAFTTIMQLDQVSGLSAPLFRTALHFVTVNSGREEPDLEAASPAMRQLLGAVQKKDIVARGTPLGGSVTIRADVSAASGNRYIREALVTFASENGRPFRIREWRRGDVVPETDPLAGHVRNIGRCLEPLLPPAS